MSIRRLDPESSLFGYSLDEVGDERRSSGQESLFDLLCHGPEDFGEPWDATWIDLGGEG